ncbi:hypothetical protein BD414DRAFT_486610 [Trametes punicea]|nr:hypothetical protein BD414DRAFT_486610 [Trametes punicea]
MLDYVECLCCGAVSELGISPRHSDLSASMSRKKESKHRCRAAQQHDKHELLSHHRTLDEAHVPPEAG